MNLLEYPDRELMMFGLADQIAADLGMALRQNDRATFSVPGGTTPGPVFDILSDVNLEWHRVTVILTDERWVPEESERSNARLVRKRLLRGRAAAAGFVPFFAPTPEPEAALERLTAALSPHLPISVLLLGMGEDMHIASLFPDAEQIAAALAPDAPALMAMRAPGLPEARVSLTARVLCDAMHSHLVVMGDKKRQVLELARNLAPEQAPVRTVLANAKVHWAP